MRIKLTYGHGDLWFQLPEDAPVNVSQALELVKNRDADVYKRWCDKEGRLRDSVAVYVNGEHIRYCKGMETELGDGDQVYIVPIVAGG
jgi:molybdopterin converting factor small subunit